MSSLQPNFSHIYIERAARDHEDSNAILSRFRRAEIIEIDDYKEVFNRPRQNWELQKSSQKLILAVKREGLIYEGSRLTPGFGHDHFFYNSLVMNCLFDCSYCYLQGMYPTANIVMFVNGSDFQEAALSEMRRCGSIYLCLSYDSDLLALESLLPHCRRWINFAKEAGGITLEIRTKSSNFSALADLEPSESVILAWTVSPDEVCSRWEKGAPGLDQRLRAAAGAMERGWPVRLCIDPIISHPGWRENYASLLKTLSESLPLAKVRDFSLGVFRMNQDFFRRMKKQRPALDIMYSDYSARDGVKSYAAEHKAELLEYLQAGLRKLSPQAAINFAAE